MNTIYEWDVEKVDRESGDILDHHFEDKLDMLKPPADDEDLCLVCDKGFHGGKGWAYVRDGELPENFTTADDRFFGKVPKRFHAEFSKWKGNQ